MTDQLSYSWAPIEDLPADYGQLAQPQLQALLAAWHSQVSELKEHDSFQAFLVRMRREWAIETGHLERLYTLTEGATKTLIEQGLDAALISHEDTASPEYTLSLIQDQYDAIQGLYQFISGGRQLTTSYIKELHTALTRHQATHIARDTLGRIVERPLQRGAWKSTKNNVEGPNGYYFEFCPPEQVASEMDRLLEMHAAHECDAIPVEVQAAWLHHRFTLIHPFDDGNGRIARCLATLVLLKAHWFPLVVTRYDRVPYIQALRSADAGDLSDLVTLFAKLQSKAVRRAFSLGEESMAAGEKIKGLIDAAKGRYARLRSERHHAAVALADTLWTVAKDRLDELAQEITGTLQPVDPKFWASLTPKRRGETAHYNTWQIVECAKKQDYFADFQAYREWLSLNIQTDVRVDVLFSFHGMGRASGILACAAMVYTRHTDEKGASTVGEVLPLGEEPFYFTMSELEQVVQRRFRSWLEATIVEALQYWNRIIGAKS